MKVYRAGWSRYQTFVNQFKIASTPATLEKVTLFIAYLGSQGLAVSMFQFLHQFIWLPVLCRVRHS